ncbi:MAG: T9SS type A sorting domain-containing protein [Candidatus Kapabacteria bacterium]|jgi:photosystem II stability/assembly factor-like uncharacterized protein|nr:T9SS type A sorting domain-containing protein [Candidatus Kapabacteria bacterium]
MKNQFIVSICLFAFCTLRLNSQVWLEGFEGDENNFFEVREAFEKYWHDKEPVRGMGWKQFKRWEYFWEQRTFPDGRIPYANDVLNSYVDFLNKNNNLKLQSTDEDWVEVGPVFVPENKLNYNSGGLGRLNVVKIHPTDKNIIWAGSAGGGAWFSTNKGESWTLAPYTDILSIGVSDIAISQSNPNVMYIATGDKNGFFMTNEYSIGILKSTDGGKSWDFTTQRYTPDSYYIANKIIIHPTNPNHVYAATNRGIMMSTDGALTWKDINTTAIFRDIIFKPDDPNTIYASTSGMSQGTSSGRIFRSTDAGTTWNIVKVLSGSSRIDLAVTALNPNIVYALAARSNGGFYSFERSTNSGASFTTMSTTPNILSIDVNGQGSGGQGFYDLAITVSPLNQDMVFAGGIHTWVSMNGGASWSILNHWTGNYNLPYVHADQHYFEFNHSANELYTANDGGLYYTKNNGKSWLDISDGLAISQFYKIDVSESSPGVIVGGTQDNGSSILLDGKWMQVNGGDGMDCAIDRFDANYVYTSTQYGNIFRSSSGGISYSRIAGPDLFQGEYANWVTPILLNPQNPSSIFVGYRNVYKSTNRGSSWVKLTNFTASAAINHLAISPSDTNILYMAVRNYVYKSTNGGKEWSILFNKANWVTDIAVDPTNPHRIFVTLSGYKQEERVFEINGKNEKNISYNLPNIPANTIVVQNNTSGRLFIGTDIGVFIKKDVFSDNWELFSNKLPPAVVSDLEINHANGKLYAGTYGRGIWEIKLYDCNLEKPEIKIIGNVEFCSGDSVLLEVVSDFEQFVWSTGETSKSITVKKSGNYFVSIKDESGCTQQSDAVSVYEISIPAFTIKSPKAMVLCGDNDTLSLSVQINLLDYRWSTGDTTNRIFVTEAGSYSIAAKTVGGCLLYDSVYIESAPIPEKPMIYKFNDTLSTDSSASYTWYLDGKPIFNSNTMEYVPTKSGDYAVMSYNEHGCGAISETISVITSVHDNTETINLFSVSPNPFNDYIRIIPNVNFDNTEFVIIDNLGRTLISDKFSSLQAGQEITLNFNNVSVGAYILLIKTESGVYPYNLRKLN